MCKVTFPDSKVTEYTANMIAENMWAQCGLDGKQHILLESIIDHKMDEHAVKHTDQLVYVNGLWHLCKMTKGAHLCVQWKDGRTSWERLANLKESYPIEVAKFAVSRGLDHKPAFAWWVVFTLRRRNRIIAPVNKWYTKMNYQYRIPVVFRCRFVNVCWCLLKAYCSCYIGV